jgi:hypothetical protein
MSFFRHVLKASGTVIAVIALFAAASSAQTPQLIVDVGDVAAFSGEQQVHIPVYLSNFSDTIAGFELWVMLDRPDIMEFHQAVVSSYDSSFWVCLQWSGPTCLDSAALDGAWDTLYFVCNEWEQQGGVCLDSTVVPSSAEWDFYHIVTYDILHVDTTQVVGPVVDVGGTLTGGWEFIYTRSITGTVHDIDVQGMADLLPAPQTPGIGPQEGGVLVDLVADVYDIPDTMTDRTVNIMIVSSIPNYLCFATPDGQCIGYIVQIVPDSNCFVCLAWAGEDCLAWQQTPWQPGGVGCDSTFVGLDTVIVIDTAAVQVLNGSLTVRGPGSHGDMNNDGSVLDISDLVFLVTYMFQGGPPPVYLWTADCDLSGGIDIADLVCWVRIMFPPQ